MFLILIFKDNLTPHYSYIIEKQKEMLKKGSTSKDLRMLDSPEYGGMPVPVPIPIENVDKDDGYSKIWVKHFTFINLMHFL